MQRIIKSRIKECIDELIKEEGFGENFIFNPPTQEFLLNTNDGRKYLRISIRDLPKVYIIQECEQSKVPEKDLLSLLNKFAKKLERNVISPDDLYIIQLEDLYTKTDDICNKTEEIVRNLGKYPKFKPKGSNLVFKIGIQICDPTLRYDLVVIYSKTGFLKKEILFSAERKREGPFALKDNWKGYTYKPGDWEKKLEEFYKQIQPNEG